MALSDGIHEGKVASTKITKGKDGLSLCIQCVVGSREQVALKFPLAEDRVTFNKALFQHFGFDYMETSLIQLQKANPMKDRPVTLMVSEGTATVVQETKAVDKEITDMDQVFRR